MPKINLNLTKEIFNPVYLPLVTNYDHRVEIYYGGAGSGKSYFVAQKLIIKACKLAPRRILVVRKTMASQKDSCWRLLLDTLSQWKLLSYCDINKSTFTITLPNGSSFLLKGIDDPEKIKSITGITDIWIEEATELNADDYTQLDLRLRPQDPSPQIILSYNPVSKVNWCYKMFHENGAPDNTIVIKTTYKDNKFLSKAYIETLEGMIKTNPAYYRIYALGEFASLDKLIFNNWEVADLPNFSFNGACFGLDFGFTADPSAFVACKVNTETKEIYIYDEMYESGMVNSAIANWLKYKGYSKEVIIADAAEQKSIEEMKRSGITHIRPCTKGQGSILYGIQKLQQYKIYVAPACTNTIVEFQNYAWKKDKKTNEYVNEPNDSFNHIMDALRYAIQRFDTGQLRTMSKAALGL